MFKNFIKKYNLKNEAISNFELQDILKKMKIKSNKYEILNLDNIKGTHWVLWVKPCY